MNTDLESSADLLQDWEARRIIQKALNSAIQERKHLLVRGITDPVLDDYIENREMQLERVENRLQSSQKASV